MVAAEAPVLIVTSNAVESALTSPDVSTAIAVKAFVPPARLPVTNDQAPFVLAVAVPIWIAPSNTSTVLSATAVPVNVRPSPAVPPDEYPLIVGVANVGVALGNSTMMGSSVRVTWTDWVFR